jgi:hypothetical protein
MVLGGLVFAPAMAAASMNKATDRSLVADVAVGPAMLLKTKSKAPAHLLKPALRLGVRWQLCDRLEIGGALTGLVSTSEHYRVLGVLGHARYALWQRPRFDLGVSAALGAGTDADILHKDLKASGTILPYGFVALDGRWALGQNWLLGAEVGFENLGMLRLGLLFGRRWR